MSIDPSLWLGKAVQSAIRLTGRGGSALPGLIVDRVDRHFVRRHLAGLEHGVIAVSGTNGKTTTTKMVVALLESQGLRVFTNRTGSNMVRGVVSALLGETRWTGRLDADVAVLELDEAHAVPFVEQVPPRHSLLLNVLRDQLDRFGEIDRTARLLGHLARATSRGVVANRDDARIVAAASGLDVPVRWFGLGDGLRGLFPGDDELHGPAAAKPAAPATPRPAADVELTDWHREPGEQHGTSRFRIGGDGAGAGGHDVTVPILLPGAYNAYNAAGALALVRMVLGPRLDEDTALAALARVTPAFGRGEAVEVAGDPVELVLVKNPAGFRASLASFDPGTSRTMIVINDEAADGRDMSWLWDVDFDSLRTSGVAAVSGIRAWDMALRLDYDRVDPGIVEPDVDRALDDFLTATAGSAKRIYCSYTAMLQVRARLARRTTVERVR